ncbi:hypothetical protein BGZ80_001503 [Entomortierella chlamydospora]|uniref:FAD-binding domain-containing protein n=1 Tax=Entomortierella chlamydospora TaxID=101097 RepID=A0A9P6MRE5_9FUNG|nr:hypothetical protein BGZ79_004722 [Entomortierella chlamydospora]KAG0010417.1 hypothetical protein BGZ80_001503 [Entomortierella chlamydospora]
MSSGGTRPTVLIVGAGIGGLALGAILERANIPYEIFEKSSSMKPLGSAIAVGPPVMPLFTQLGVIDQIAEKGIVFERSDVYSEKDGLVLQLDFVAGAAEKFGWPGYIISRPNLHNILLSLIPPERILLNKRVLSHVETGTGIMIRTSDNMTHEGNILVGADGTYSAVRQSLYGQMDKRGLLPSSDKKPLRSSTICLVGQTRPFEPKGYEFNDNKKCTYESILLDGKPVFIVTFTTAENTICWKLIEYLDKETSKTNNIFRSSEWGPEAADVMCKEVRDYPVVRGMKMGDLIDATPKEVICKVMLEEKLFETWTYGRTVLLGDACHKMNPSGGLGAQTAMSDAVILANYINTLHTVELEDVEKALKTYRNERYPIGKQAVETSAVMFNIIKQDWRGRMIRYILKYIPRWLWFMIRAQSVRCRPQISFLPLAEDKCQIKAIHQPSLEKTRPKNTAANA